MGDRNTDDIREYARKFLLSVRAYLRTGDYSIVSRKKNMEFDRRFPLTDQARKKILMSLKAEDCIKVAPNDHPGYPAVNVYVFRKTAQLFNVYGEPDAHRLYIKLYLVEKKNVGTVVVISFHDDEYTTETAYS